MRRVPHRDALDAILNYARLRLEAHYLNYARLRLEPLHLLPRARAISRTPLPPSRLGRGVDSSWGGVGAMKAREGLLCFVPHEHACGGGCVYPHSHLGTVASLCIALHAFCIFECGRGENHPQKDLLFCLARRKYLLVQSRGEGLGDRSRLSANRDTTHTFRCCTLALSRALSGARACSRVRPCSMRAPRAVRAPLLALLRLIAIEREP